MNLCSAPQLLGLQCPFLVNDGAGHRSVMEGLLGWNDGMTLESHPSLEMYNLVMLKFPPSWNIVELAHLSCGLIGSTEYFLSPPFFCSSSHPRGALSGRTSMSEPKVCGFEHHSVSLARCQHSSWFCCRTQPFDQKGLIRARFSPSEAAVFKSRGSIFMFSPS